MKRDAKKLMAFSAGLMMLLCFSAVAQTRSRFGLKLVQPKPSEDFVYEDAFIRIRFVPLTQIAFELQNKTTNVIEVLWSQASFVDTSGEAHRVIHEGIRYIERNTSLPSTVIPPGAKITDVFHPADYVEYVDGKWQLKMLFDQPYNAYGDKTFTVFLPLKVGAVTKRYSFVFKFDPPLPTLLSAALRQERITASQFGKEWPLILSEAVILCHGTKEKPIVFIKIASRFYAINDSALNQKVDNQPVNHKVGDEWILLNQSEGRMNRMSLEPLTKHALGVCSK
jgi:hypothetical protein